MDLAHVRVASWKTAYRGLLPDSTLDEMQVTDGGARWKEMLTEGKSQTLVYEQGGSVVGFVSFGASRDDDAKDVTGEIWGIYLLPSVWRSGYGKALLTKALKSLEQRGCSEVTLWVLANNRRAIRFYEAMGFSTDGASKVVTTGGGVQLHEVRYRRATRCSDQWISGHSGAVS
jgi:ribosomal protein S18 acetylase RimI-like enzyme